MIHFQSLNCHWSLLLDQIPLKLDWEGIKESEDGERGGWRGDYSREAIIVLIFLSNVGVYLRESINRGTAIIRGNMVLFWQKNGSCKGIGPKGRASLYNTLLRTPWQNQYNCITLLLTKKNYPDETSRCSKTNALLERQRPKKCEPQLLRSLPFCLPIPLERAQGGGGGWYSTNIWV